MYILNSKIVSTKTTSAIFLAFVLVTGTIAAIFPFMGVAQAQPYYGMDNRYSSYGPPEYPSYKPDYKPTYPSYDGKDNRDKSKDSKSVEIKKINCINTNLNINGNNTGDVNIGNKGQAAYAEEGYSGAYSSGSGYDDAEGYYDGNYKKDKGITCIINNNNNNTNIVSGAGGNATDGNGNVTACEECFF